MNTNAFANEVAKVLTDTYGVNAEVTVTEKINGPVTGIVVGTGTIRPTINVPDVEELHDYGIDVKDAAKKVYEIYLEAMEGSSDVCDLIANITDFASVKDKIYAYCVDSRKTNMDNKVTVPVSDNVCAGFYILLPNNANVKIEKRLMETWGIDTQTLHDTARENMENNMRFEDVMDTLKKLYFIKYGVKPDPQMFEIPAGMPPQYVLSTENRTLGAGFLAYPDLIQKAMESAGIEDAYIIPSSIHELMIVPAELTSDEHLNNLIEEVNNTLVAPNETLADNAYKIRMGNAGIIVAA